MKLKFPSHQMKVAGENFVITPDYCRGILEAEALFRVLVIACAAALVATLGLTVGRALILTNQLVAQGIDCIFQNNSTIPPLANNGLKIPAVG